MAANSSSGAVLAALLGNTFLTVIKFVAFLASGSGAMLSEAIHSFADSSNQGLLLLGIRKSERRPDAMFPYGYGVDRYFFSLMSAVGIFLLGCGVTVYHGIQGLLHPHEISVGWLTWVVLAVSFVVEAFVLFKALEAVKEEMRSKGLRGYLRDSTDPTVAAVLFEDGVAVTGVIVAAIGIILSQQLGTPIPDALASIVIGLMMGMVAIWLGYKNRELILGRAMPPELQKEIVEFLTDQPSIHQVKDVRTRVIGADTFRLKADVEFEGGAVAATLVDWVVEEVPAITGRAQAEKFAQAFGDRLLESLGDEVDRIESRLIERYPGIRFIDLEAD